jgi:hypothetical protein
VGEILRLWCRFAYRLALALISAVAPYAGLIAVQNVWDGSAKRFPYTCADAFRVVQ